jgi:branched-subunit amino acid ABC-type transport system permease component
MAEVHAIIDFVQNTIDGLMIGSSYALLALGFTLIFGVMRRLNLSYGPSIMVGAYLGTLAYVQLSVGPLAVAVVTVVGAVAAGLYVERLCFAPMTAGAGIASMVSSFAIWMQLEQAAILALPRHTYPFPPLTPGAPLELGPFMVRMDHLVMLAVALALAAAIHLALYRSRFGLALRAIVASPVAAQLVGINPKATIVWAFAIASALGGIAGYLVLAVDQQVTPMFGMWATVKGLIAMMIGGLGSIPGALLGGLILGLVEAHSQWYWGPQVRDLIAYLLLFACLVARPGGLVGETPAPASAVGRWSA